MKIERRTALAPARFPAGEVWLVGAGPGHPDLLTLRAVQALGQADLVLHDALPGRAVLHHVRRGAEIIAVGKRKGSAPVPQAETNARIVAAAQAGLRVLRLKGGDPFIFGRGGEEAAACDAAGIRWRVIPGVSSGLAAPALAGIPLTHRGLSRAVTFLTAHDETGGLAPIDWTAVARLGGTVAVFMGLSRLDEVALRLISGGRAASTPVAVMSQASLPGQRSVQSTLGTCTLDVRRGALASPALVVIGEVAALGLTLPADDAAAERLHHG